VDQSKPITNPRTNPRTNLSITGISKARLAILAKRPEALANLGHGIEKESLRVTPDGALSNKPHPTALGSALTHPTITTDFSESQLELIAGVHTTPDACIKQLEEVHGFVHANMDNEVLWPSSMPCLLGEANDIPIGQYGNSNVAKAKSVYRQGLANRYGSLMQTISGIHYNFSMSEGFWTTMGSLYPNRTSGYFDLIRNFRRHSWLLIYLFGASPAVCKSFAKNMQHDLESLDEGSLYRPHGTSLRMGRLGYQSDAQAGLHVSYNNLPAYADSMRRALSESYPAYEDIGVKVDGEYRQLNTTLIQIENEFYGTIRPKQPINSGERPLTALLDRGVEYVEVRCMDLNPFLPVGIDVETCRFLDTFLIYCLLADSPDDSALESERMQSNQLAVVAQGRKPGLKLASAQGEIELTQWGGSLLEQCSSIAQLLDQVHGGSDYAAAIAAQELKLEQPEHTPSAMVLAQITEQKIPFFRFAMNQAITHQAHFAEQPLSGQQTAAMIAQSQESIVKQKQIEAADTLSFDDFLMNYLALPEAAAP
jgi:glutamate--cysteine ligase